MKGIYFILYHQTAMPEIWLRYGTTDVALDIRFENLASQISASFAVMSDEERVAVLGSVPVSDNMLVLVLSSSKAAALTVDGIVNAAQGKGLTGITVDVLPAFAGPLRANLSSEISINRVDYQSLEERLKKFQSTVIVSQVAYDPLFGFAGAPTTILRNFFTGKMTEMFRTKRAGKPEPGVENEMFRAAISFSEGIAATSIELVASRSGIAGMYVGSVDKAFAKALSHLRSISVTETDAAKSAIISASSESGPQLTLASSLNSLWNSIHAVREGGSIVLLSEGREGLGGGALQMFAEGRLKTEQLAHTEYISGLEHIVYLQELAQKYELGVVSTLPHYYLKKLGFLTFASVKDALDKLLAKQGKSHKLLVISDADISLVRARS